MRNDEFQEERTVANGTTLTRIRGRLVLRFTNQAAGYGIVRDVSGPATYRVRSNGSGTVVATGTTWNALGPLSRGHIHEPGLLTTGHRELHFTDQIVTRLRAQRHSGQPV